MFFQVVYNSTAPLFPAKRLIQVIASQSLSISAHRKYNQYYTPPTCDQFDDLIVKIATITDIESLHCSGIDDNHASHTCRLEILQQCLGRSVNEGAQASLHGDAEGDQSALKKLLISPTAILKIIDHCCSVLRASLEASQSQHAGPTQALQKRATELQLASAHALLPLFVRFGKQRVGASGGSSAGAGADTATNAACWALVFARQSESLALLFASSTLRVGEMDIAQTESQRKLLEQAVQGIDPEALGSFFSIVIDRLLEQSGIWPEQQLGGQCVTQIWSRQVANLLDLCTRVRPVDGKSINPAGVLFRLKVGDVGEWAAIRLGKGQYNALLSRIILCCY